MHWANALGQWAPWCKKSATWQGDSLLVKPGGLRDCKKCVGPNAGWISGGFRQEVVFVQYNTIQYYRFRQEVVYLHCSTVQYYRFRQEVVQPDRSGRALSGLAPVPTKGNGESRRNQRRQNKWTRSWLPLSSKPIVFRKTIALFVFT